MKTKLLYAKTAMFALACFSSVGVWGQTKITDEKGLKAMAENLAGDYVLENNITLSGEWEPIGTNDAPFTGTIDGKGHTIYGLKINLPEQNSVGFIGAAKIEEVSSTKTTVKNLRLVGVEITGRQDVGTVIGNSYGARVSECYTSGLVYGWDHTGGIIGGTKKASDDIMTEVSNCYSNAAVVSSSYQAGGIIGASNNAVVDHCYFAGVAVCPEGRSGGIVALNDGNSLTIANCVVLSSYIKAGGGEAGGANAILGADNPAKDSNAVSTISKCYSWSDLKLYENNVEIGRTNNANDSYDGGYIDSEKLKTAAFWLATDNKGAGFDAGIWTVAENTYPSLPGVQTPLENGFYIPSFPERCLPGKTFNATAVSASGRTITYTSSDPAVATIDVNGLVTFIKDGKTTLTFSDPGDDHVKGIEKNYELVVKGVAYTIMDEEDLKCIKYDLAGDFKLGADIYLTKDWELLKAFTGTLDGQGYAIHGLRFVNDDQNYVGLFGEANGATIQRVGIVGAYINANTDVGAIVGYASDCTISECFIDQSSYIAGRDHVGSIAGTVSEWKSDEGGEGKGTIVSDCYSMAKVYSRDYQAGGIAGVVNFGTVERCYFSGNIQSRSGRAGGIFALVDANGTVLIQNNVCLASGIYCTEGTFCIGEKGNREHAQLLNNYYGETASYKGADLASSSITDTAADGEMISDRKTLLSKTYSDLGWDLNDVWTFIEGGEGKMYPILKCQQSKEVTPFVYGIPNPAALIQKANGEARNPLNLGKVKTTTGQTLTLKVTAGKEYVDIDDQLTLYFTELVENEATATISITTPSIAGVNPINVSSFDVKMISSSYVFDINSLEDLLGVNNRLYANFRLMKDIDMKGVEFYGIGSLATPYTGIFDGNGFSILNPVVKTNDDNTKGFFNAVNGATIKKLGIANFSFEGSRATGNKSTDLGGFAGAATDTKFDQCYFTGKVVGRDHVGGFVGGNTHNVTITNSFVNADVFALSQAGGFFGVSAGDVKMENCYFAGSVKLNPADHRGWAGGFLGLVDEDCIVTIQGCVSIGDVQGADAAGFFIGGNGTTPEEPRGVINFKNNLFNYNAKKILLDDKQTPSINDWESRGYLIKGGDNVSGGASEVYFEDGDFFKQSIFEEATFDFDTVWTIEEGVSYPTLKNVLYWNIYPSPPVGIIQVADKEETTYTVSVSDGMVSISGIEDIANVALYNMNGQVVSQEVASAGSAQLPATGKGLYIVRIIEKNTVTSVKLVVK